MSTVLLAADASWVINDVKAALATPDRKVVIHADPRTLVAAAREHDPVIAVIDLQVGSMGGMAMARALKDAHAIDRLPSIPTVLLLDRKADAFLAKRAAADGWLLKPFDVHELRSLVEGLVDPAETAVE